MLVYIMTIDSPNDQSKFEQIYNTYKGLMYHVAFKILNNESDAEDAVHNAFMKIAEHIRKISEPVCPKTQSYVVTIVERKAIDIYRSHQRKQHVEYNDEIVGMSVDAHQISGLSLCLAKLPLRYRESIMLKYYHGLTCKEIARHLNISESNAIKLDQRSKRKLLQICKEEGVL